MRHPMPLLWATLSLIILGGTIMRNITCPCGIPAAVISNAVSAVAVTTPSVEENMSLTPASVSADATRLNTIEQRLKSKEIVINFDFNQSTTSLTDEQIQTLEDIKYYLSQNNNSTITIEGHTDSRGKVGYNKLLSESRASFIGEYLTQNSDNAQEITTIGKGEVQPSHTNKTDDGRAQNRRVVIFIQ
jgi:outer membrane protein OmpA-like peptidoglycan-associated protein